MALVASSSSRVLYTSDLLQRAGHATRTTRSTPRPDSPTRLVLDRRGVLPRRRGVHVAVHQLAVRSVKPTSPNGTSRPDPYQIDKLAKIPDGRQNRLASILARRRGVHAHRCSGLVFGVRLARPTA
ncbi:MAG: hypothetical protein MZU97_26435 [Bacillus subtilis]|nr:hypothetical protein [Bacillus subtilis]